jgi:homoserine O-acetyltransferase
MLQDGATLRGARLAYKPYSTLSATKDNAIVYPTWYSGLKAPLGLTTSFV